MNRYSDAELNLIARLKAGDVSAVDDLAAAYGSKIHQLAFRYMKNREDAEEVAQDVLMKVYRKIDAFRGDSALSFVDLPDHVQRACPGSHGSVSRPKRGARRGAGRHGQRRAHAVCRTRRPTGRPLADEAYLRSEMRDRLQEALARAAAHLPGPGAAARCRGAVDRGSKPCVEGQDADAQVTLHRGVSSCSAAGRLRGGAHASSGRLRRTVYIRRMPPAAPVPGR